MAADPKSIVGMGYDRIAEEYLARYSASAVRDRWLAELMRRLPQHGGAHVLDLGCGAGLPVAHRLTAQGHNVIGVDGSAHQVVLARRNVPAATFIQSDMTAVDLPPGSFDAVVAFYAVTHVPRVEHADLLERIAGWLKPRGIFVASLGAGASPDCEGEWLGTTMFFSHYEADTNLVLLRDAGFVVELAEEQDQDNEDARFLWVVARRGTIKTMTADSGLASRP